MKEKIVALETNAAPFTLHTYAPEGAGPYPAVVLLMDGFGPRAALFEMAARIAEGGYVTVVPDLFHRVGSVLEWATPELATTHGELTRRVLGDPELRQRWRERFFSSATNEANIREDLNSVIDYLAACPDVVSGKLGVVGYCMGGNIALRASAMLGKRVAAVASFHGGFLATDAPDSPHLGIGKMSAPLLVVGAAEDSSFTDEMRDRLTRALEVSQLTFEVKSYQARHGFCIGDAPTFDAAAAERHFRELLAFFGRHLG